MKLVELLDPKQPKLHFEYITDSEGDKNRGWQVDEIRAFNDIEKVGYLKLTYIPSKRFKEWYPSILHFLSNVEGKLCLPMDYRKTPLKKIPLDELHPCRAAMYVFRHVPYEEQVRLEKLPNDEKLAYFLELEKAAKKLYGKRFKEFKEYFVDKPYVDFIRAEDGYQNQKIGTALYDAGNQWMKSKGLKLYGSGTQTIQAKGAWDKFQKQGLTSSETANMYKKTFPRRFLK
jgi:GNAT superfamily N-acetyltransferase